jgi:hypothetical protein
LRCRCCDEDQYTIPMESPPKGILTVLAAERRGCRSFVGAVVHDVEVWGSRQYCPAGCEIKRVVRAHTHHSKNRTVATACLLTATPYVRALNS